jgi:hypothetical protein
MAQQKEVKITISKDGNSASIEVNGVKGGSCSDITSLLEKSLGVVTDRTIKDEFYDPEIGDRVLIGI